MPEQRLLYLDDGRFRVSMLIPDEFFELSTERIVREYLEPAIAQMKQEHADRKRFHLAPPFETFKGATCKGSYLFGSACGKCEKCAWERSIGGLGLPKETNTRLT